MTMMGDNGKKPSAALYVHIPFCEQRCCYCDFYTVVHRNLDEILPVYLEALKREITLYAKDPYWSGLTYATVFFGGGTPSLLSPAQLADLMEHIYTHFQLTPSPEVTLEANPGTVDSSRLQGYRLAGINRLSLGVQSFIDEELRQLDRLHSVEDIFTTFQAAREAGFGNINLDLMFALPGQRPSNWRYTLQQAVALHPEHLSCYNLTIEPGTPLYNRLQQGEIRPLTEWRERALYAFTIDFLEKHGYFHYEVSNFARPGFHCRHNVKYWDGSAYLGIGASAHSYDGRQRFWNVDNYFRYIQLLKQELRPVAGHETLTEKQKQFEMIFLGLRRHEGVDLKRYRAEFQRELLDDYASQVDKLLNHRPPLVVQDGTALRLTREGRLLCDAVCAEFA